MVERLKTINIDHSQVNVILLTHEHSDHIKGVDVLLKSSSARVMTTEATASNIKTEYEVEHVTSGDRFWLNDEVELEVVTASHDAADAVGFIFYANGKKIVHLTDSGYIVRENIVKFENSYSYTIESNYEEEVLIVNDKYPFKVKQRILSDQGHLSNIDCNTFLETSIGEKTKYVQFAHLSEKNNTPELVEQLNRELPVENKTVLLKDEIIEVNLCK